MRRAQISLRAALACIVALGLACYGLLLPDHPEWPLGWRLQSWLEAPDVRERRLFEERWQRACAEFRERQASVPAGSLLLLGSSTFEQLPRDVVFPGRPVVSLAIGGEPLSHLKERLASTLPQQAPAGLLLYLGAVDFHRLGRSPTDVAADAAEILRTLSIRYPGVPRLLLGVLPARDSTPADLERLVATHQALAEVAARHGDEFVCPLGTPLTDASGRLRPEISRDRNHLNADGYVVLAQLLRSSAGPIGRALDAH